jgi:DNA-binding transcriptional regulator YiaG
MPSFFDATCGKCGRRFGWCGEFADKPACPRCGYDHSRPKDKASDAKDAETIRKTMAYLKLHPRDATPAQLIEMRRLSGLTFGQAARRLGCGHEALMDIEDGKAALPADLAGKMAELYGCGRG